jgi:hypothetical protein
MRTTFLCVTCRARISSRLKRRSISCSAAGSFSASGRITFSATTIFELLVPGLIDRAHPANAQQLHDRVAAEALRDAQRTG